MKWYIPSWSGDFRLERVTDITSLLTVEDPTPGDMGKLRTFFVEARERGWVDAAVGVAPKGRTEIPVAASVSEAGPFLSGVIYMPRTPLWLVVKSVGGEIRVWDTEAQRLMDEEAARTRNVKIKEAAEEAERDAALAKITPQTTDAAAIRPPRVGCPAPLACNRRASEVLRAFSTARQIADFEAKGYMRVVGNTSGEVYYVFHRDEAARRGFGHSVVKADGAEVCVWDDGVPAEEEALGIKLGLEHREISLLGRDRIALLG